MYKKDTFKFLFFSLQICCHFQLETTLRTLLGSSFKMADKVADLKLTCYHFLKTLNIRLNLHSRVIQILFTGMYYLFIPCFFLLDSPIYFNMNEFCGNLILFQ